MEDLSVYYEDKFIKRNVEITSKSERVSKLPEGNKNGLDYEGEGEKGAILNKIVQKFRSIIDEKHRTTRSQRCFH